MRRGENPSEVLDGHPRGGRRPQRHGPAAGRPDRADLRPHGPGRQHAAHGHAHAARRTGDRRHRAVPVPGQRARGAADRDHHSALAAVRVHLHALHRHPGEPAEPRRARFRHHRRRHAGHGGAHRARAATSRRSATAHGERPRHDSRRRARSGTADLLLAAHHHLGLHPAVHAGARGAPPVHADGVHRLLRAARLDAARADADPGAGDVPVPQRAEDLGQPGAALAAQRATSGRCAWTHRLSRGVSLAGAAVVVAAALRAWPRSSAPSSCRSSTKASSGSARTFPPASRSAKSADLASEIRRLVKQSPEVRQVARRPAATMLAPIRTGRIATSSSSR